MFNGLCVFTFLHIGTINMPNYVSTIPVPCTSGCTDSSQGAKGYNVNLIDSMSCVTSTAAADCVDKQAKSVSQTTII